MVVVQRPKAKRWNNPKRKPKMDLKSLPRVRNDSGYFDDDDGGYISPSAQAEMVFANWSKTTETWENRAKTVINEEIERMDMLNEARKKRLLENGCANLQEIEASWLSDLESMVSTTQGLLHCVSNDILLGAEAVPLKVERLEKHHLSKIPEEHEGKDVFIVHRGKHSKKNTPKQSKVWIENEVRNEKSSLGSIKPHNNIKMNVDVEPEDVDIMYDWIKMLRRGKGGNTDINKAFWDISLKPKKMKQGFKDCNDPLHDSCELLTRNMEQEKTSPKSSQPTKCYWNIFNEWKHNLEENPKRRRRLRSHMRHLAEVKKHKHHPPAKTNEITTRQKNVPHERNKQPVKCYWNIFDEWKHNLDEHPIRRRRLRSQKRAGGPTKRRHRYHKPGMVDFFRDARYIFDENQEAKRRGRFHKHNRKGRRIHKHRRHDPDMADYFRDARHIFDESKPIKHRRLSRNHPFNRSFRRHSREVEDFFRDARHIFDEPKEANRCCSFEEVDKGDEVLAGSSVKRMKSANAALETGTWEFIKLESETSFTNFTSNIEDKIKSFFRQESLMDEFIDWPKDLAYDLGDPEDCLVTFLRDEVRRARKERHLRNARNNYVSYFRDWRWNLDSGVPNPKSNCEDVDIFQRWRWIFNEPKHLDVEEDVDIFKKARKMFRELEDLHGMEDVDIFQRWRRLFNIKDLVEDVDVFRKWKSIFNESHLTNDAREDVDIFSDGRHIFNEDIDHGVHQNNSKTLHHPASLCFNKGDQLKTSLHMAQKQAVKHAQHFPKPMKNGYGMDKAKTRMRNKTRKCYPNQPKGRRGF